MIPLWEALGAVLFVSGAILLAAGAAEPCAVLDVAGGVAVVASVVCYATGARTWGNEGMQL